MEVKLRLFAPSAEIAETEPHHAKVRKLQYQTGYPAKTLCPIYAATAVNISALLLPSFYEGMYLCVKVS